MAATETAASNFAVYAHWLTTATGATSAVTVRSAKLIDVAIDFGSGTGTVALEGEYRTKTTATINDAQWQTIEEYTADTVKVARVAGARRVRLNCSAHGGSGTVAAELTAGNKE